MKKVLILMLALIALVAVMGCALAMEAELPVEEMPDTNAAEPFDWGYLATIAGAAAFTLLIVQFFKLPLDRVWKMPTRVFAYLVALGIMLVATAFTAGLKWENALLVCANAFIAAMTAYGAYELTFKKIDK